MSRIECDDVIKEYQCPSCSGPLCISHSPCYDNECCGIEDTIRCDQCDFEIECWLHDDPEILNEVLIRHKVGLRL